LDTVAALKLHSGHSFSEMFISINFGMRMLTLIEREVVTVHFLNPRGKKCEPAGRWQVVVYSQWSLAGCYSIRRSGEVATK
jgi:hypothetical protein